LRYANAKLTLRTLERHRDVLLGVKIRLSRNIAGGNDMAALRLAREAADAAGLPVMVHIGDTHSPLPEILAMLRKGDVITHAFHGRNQGILDGRGRALPEVVHALAQGVLLDVGHGRGSFSWKVMEAAMRQNLLPGTISSDVHQFNVAGPVFDLATTLSKFLHLGLTLDQVIERATILLARAFRFPHQPGTLQPGAVADVAVFDLVEGDFEFPESYVSAAEPEKRVGHRKLVPVATVKDGKLYGSAGDSGGTRGMKDVSKRKKGPGAGSTGAFRGAMNGELGLAAEDANKPMTTYDVPI